MAAAPTANCIASLQKDLAARIDEQNNAGETDIPTAKDATKSALFSLLEAVSAAPKDDLPVQVRQQVDDFLMANATILKWPLLRSLSWPKHYRAFLGLPKTMEQTRRFLTTVSSAKLQDILVHNLDLSEVAVGSQQDLVWMQDVLQQLTGDGRRKKELGGFVLLDKNAVRAAINKAKSRQKELQKLKEQADTTAKATKVAKPVHYEMERDVRLVDQERQTARASDLSSLVDAALEKKQQSK
ncbi:expressed unknown protein [Seminavis robusta]|uniref:Uncharacterized protein n=1 Tax=Seminavis robusta TaxID=568900 RepID=A0A9N8DPY8_9STRA|nr:expressed unknown protein [Seminavis robusta]|eukprot:Sro272_g104750.1 n/a (241) ;mRNA; r:5689-6411